ncbi:helix-turn-helix transcriptional regulator [Rhodobacteraceae bacterium NNCM2]|nr:helix-turn-helix transcriptional regulator [Coraliihabitans acroporae]
MENIGSKSTETQLAPEDAAEIFSALGAPVRLKILRALVRAGEHGMVVGALQERLSMPGSTLSHHLRALIQAGIVEQRREGRSLICNAKYLTIHALAEFLLTECCEDVAGGCPEEKNAT